MRIWGKLAGFLIGLLAFHSFPIALLGLVVGHLVIDSGWLLGLARSGNTDGYVEPLFTLMGALAKSDGRVSETEVSIAERLMTRLQLDSLWRRRAIEAFNAGKAPDFNLAPALDRLRTWCVPRRSSVMPFLDMLCDIALADGPLSEAKLRMLKLVAAALRVGDIQLVALLAMKGFAWNAGPRPGGWTNAGGWSAGQQQGSRSAAQNTIGPDPYTVLGVTREADQKTIKRAYRKLISQFHPDRLGNMPEDMRKRAEARASEINAAYERIQSERGFR